MAIEITIPRLGWSMEQGTFGEWLKSHGEAVSLGDAVFALESDKALQEVESIDEGTLHIIKPGPAPGDTVDVGQVIGYLLAEGETPPAPAADETRPTGIQRAQAENASSAGKVASNHSTAAASEPNLQHIREYHQPAASPAVRRLAAEMGIDWRSIPAKGTLSKNDLLRFVENVSSTATDRKPKLQLKTGDVPERNGRPEYPHLTPRAYRTAREYGVDWTQVKGTGRNGRIREQDILNQIVPQGSEPLNQSRQIPGRWEASSRIRRMTVKRLQQSQQNTIPVTLTTVADASDLVSLRQEMKQRHLEPLPTYNDMILKLVADCLKECPSLNACWEGEGIWLYDEVNLAMAVQGPDGLTAPVIKNADCHSLGELTAATRSLIERTRNGGLRAEHLEAGTFTVSNLGMYGIEHFTPVIAYPQSAILGVGQLAATPVIYEESVVPGYRLPLSLTFDHQATDGAPAAQWLQLLAQRISAARQHLEIASP